MSDQLALFAAPSPLPEGLHYTEDFISPATEQELITHVSALPLQPFQFGIYEGKRRVASFGFRYDYALRRLETPSRSRPGSSHSSLRLKSPAAKARGSRR